ncbi:MAG: HEAT repeat domain-containing protein [Caldilineaceae bacterium]
MGRESAVESPQQDPSAALLAFVAAIDAGVDEATEALVSTLAPADESALVALAAKPGDHRWWALRALAAVGADAAATALATAAIDADPSVRAVVALGLGHLHTRAPQAVAAHFSTLATLLQDPDGFVRQAAVDGLALCGEAALPTLATVLFESDHQGARTRAAAALRAMRSIKAAPLLYRILNDPNHLVHTFAHEALDDLGLLDNVLLLP